MAQQVYNAALVGTGKNLAYTHVEGSVEIGGFQAEIRRFRWDRRYRGQISASRYYLDFSLTNRPRLSLLRESPGQPEQRPGDLVFLPAGACIDGQTACGEHHALLVSFDDDTVRQVLNMEPADIGFRPCVDLRNALIHSSMRRLAREILSPGFASDAMMQSIVVALVVELSRHFRGERRVRSDHPGHDIRRVVRVRNVIENQLQHRLSVAELAEECSISPRHLSRIFKQSTGMTVGEYISHTRLARAKELLENEDMLVKTVGWECGFDSPAAFTAAFRKATGYSPQEFRALFRRGGATMDQKSS